MVGEDILEHHRRRGRSAGAVRVDHGNALDRGEPEFSVVRCPGYRLRAAVALAAHHAVGFSVPNARHLRHEAFGEIIELLTGDAEDAFVAAHPEVAAAVFE